MPPKDVSGGGVRPKAWLVISQVSSSLIAPSLVWGANGTHLALGAAQNAKHLISLNGK